jgi:tetratricopeptide (TPR) repeat protein
MRQGSYKGEFGRLVVFSWIIVAALATYYNAFRNAFQLDDFHIAVNNPWVHSLRNVPRFFVDPFTFSTIQSNADYRPLLSATYALNYAISQDHPWSWHALSLFLHITVAISLFYLGRTLFGRNRIVSISWLSEEDGELISFAAAILFVVHPIATAAVNYMSARSSLLVTALVLPATVLYLRALRDRASVNGIILPLLLYALALLSKVEAISLLGVLYAAELLFAPRSRKTSPSGTEVSHKQHTGKSARGVITSVGQWLLPDSSGWRRWLPFALLTVVYIVFRLIILPPGLNYAWGVPVFTHSTYLLTQFRTWWYYVGEVIAPIHMVADYGAYPVSSSLLDPRVLYALAGWAIVGALLLYAIRRAPAVAFLGLAYFIHLSPHSSFMPISEMVNEHRPYLPSTSLFLLGSVGLFLIVRKLADRPHLSFAVLVLILAIPLAALSYDRNKVWKDEMSFWSDIVRKDPEAPRGQMNYGLVLMARGDYSEAEYRFREAIRLSPAYNLAHINLGIDLAAQGFTDEARAEYDLAVRLAANDPTGYYWRGLFFSKQGDLPGAIADLQKAASLATVPGRELEALADNLIRADRMQEAREAIERGAALDPNRFNALRERLK